MLALHLRDPDSECHWANMSGRFGKSKKRIHIVGGKHTQSMEICGEQVNQLKWNGGFK